MKKFLSIFIIASLLIFSCSKKTYYFKKDINRPIETAEAKGQIILYGNGIHEIVFYHIKKDKDKAFVVIRSQYGPVISKIYKVKDSIWIVLPFKKVVYFQKNSNILMVPGLLSENIPVGAIFDLLIGNFSFSSSILNPHKDTDLLQSFSNMNYVFYEGRLIQISYKYMDVIYSFNISYIGSKLKINLKKNSKLYATLLIEDRTIYNHFHEDTFILKIPKDYQIVEL